MRLLPSIIYGVFFPGPKTLLLFGELFLMFALGFAPGWANGWPGGLSIYLVWPAGLTIILVVMLTTVGLGIGGCISLEQNMSGRPSSGLPSAKTGFAIWFIMASVACPLFYVYLYLSALSMWPNGYNP